MYYQNQTINLKSGGNSNTAKIKMKTLAEKIQSFASQVESMSQFKVDLSKRGQEIYKEYQDKLPVIIEELRKEGASELTHPKFSDAMITYNAWK